MIRAHWVAAAVASALVLARGAPAEAQSKRPPPQKIDQKMVEAKRLFDEGAELYTKGSYEEAIDAWEQSYALSRKPLIFESIANAYERLGQLKKARDYLMRWHDVAPSDELEILDTRIKNLDARLAHEEQTESARKAEEDKLRKDREKSGAAEPNKTTTPPPQEPETKPFIPGYIMAVAGGAAIIVGVTLDLVAAGRRPDESTACASSSSSSRQVCLASDKDSIQSSNTLAVVGDVTWIAGGVVGATGVVLALMLTKPATAEQGTTSPTKTKTSFSPTMVPGHYGLSVRRSF